MGDKPDDLSPPMAEKRLKPAFPTPRGLARSAIAAAFEPTRQAPPDVSIQTPRSPHEDRPQHVV